MRKSVYRSAFPIPPPLLSLAFPIASLSFESLHFKTLLFLCSVVLVSIKLMVHTNGLSLLKNN